MTTARYNRKHRLEQMRKAQRRQRLVTFLVTTVGITVLITAGMAFRNWREATAQQRQHEAQTAVFANPDNPECPYDTPFIERATETRMETKVDLDLSEGGTAHNIWLVVPAAEVAFLTDGRIKPAQELETGDEIHLTGDKRGVVTATEHKLYTPEPVQGDAYGNVLARVIGKSERWTETILYLHTANEAIATTPEHPFYVNGVYVEAQNLQQGDQIRTKNGRTVAVERTEIRQEPQMVYSLLVEGAHNFYVGTQGLLAHNCTPVFGEIRFRGLDRNRNVGDLTHNQIYNSLSEQGLDPSNHFIQQLRDPRTSNLGVSSLQELENVFNYGELVDADNGLRALAYDRLAVVFNPDTGRLVTIRPWE